MVAAFQGLLHRGSWSNSSSVSDFRNSIRSRLSPSVSLERPQDPRLVDVIHPAARRVVIDHLFQRGHAAVVHVRRGDGDIAKSRRSKLSDVLGTLRVFIKTAIGLRYADTPVLKKPVPSAGLVVAAFETNAR